MIAYFDTSAVIPLLLEETASAKARECWLDADRVASARIVDAEACAALAQATCTGRIAPTELRVAVDALDAVYARLELLEIDDRLVHHAGTLAEERGLRGYDAVHLAAADLIRSSDLLFVDAVVVGDRRPCSREPERYSLAGRPTQIRSTMPPSYSCR